MGKNSKSDLIDILSASSVEEIWQRNNTNIDLYCCSCGEEKEIEVSRWMNSRNKIDNLTLTCISCGSASAFISNDCFSLPGFANQNIAVHFVRKIKKNLKVNFGVAYLLPRQPSTYIDFNIHVDSCMDFIKMSFDQVKMQWED